MNLAKKNAALDDEGGRRLVLGRMLEEEVRRVRDLRARCEDGLTRMRPRLLPSSCGKRTRLRQSKNNISISFCAISGARLRTKKTHHGVESHRGRPAGGHGGECIIIEEMPEQGTTLQEVDVVDGRSDHAQLRRASDVVCGAHLVQAEWDGNPTFDLRVSAAFGWSAHARRKNEPRSGADPRPALDP